MVDTRETFAHAVYRDKELTTEQRVEWLWKCCRHYEGQIERYERSVEFLATYPLDPDGPCADRLREFHAALVASVKATIQPPRERDEAGG